MTTVRSTDRSSAVTIAVARLENSARIKVPCEPVRDLIGETDIKCAYEVQRQLTERRLARGAIVVGRKIGLTSVVVQRQLDVDCPDFGFLFDDMDVSRLSEVPSDRLLQPRVEAEIAFLLGTDLDFDTLDRATVRAGIEYATAALEIVDSRVSGWDIRITDTVADNASSGLYVLSDNHVSLAEFEPVDVTMRMFVDDELVSEGDGRATMGDPLNALLWLARTARDFGEPLRAGQVVLSGSLGPLVPVSPGARVRAEISTLGQVTANFSSKENR